MLKGEEAGVNGFRPQVRRHHRFRIPSARVGDAVGKGSFFPSRSWENLCDTFLEGERPDFDTSRAKAPPNPFN